MGRSGAALKFVYPPPSYMATLTTRPATPDDTADIARIYNEGIEDRVGTFETRPRTPADIEAWFDGRHPIVVVEAEGEVVGFASTSMYRARDCYAGIAEFSVYVARSHRGHGAGRCHHHGHVGSALGPLCADGAAGGCK